jgi:NAD(P)H-hydrate epimerase
VPTRSIHLSRAQSRRLDQLAVERYLMPSIILMENAARSATEQALDMLGGRTDATVLITCGGGNNGGDGLAIARHLHNRGLLVRLALACQPDQLAGDARTNLQIVQAMALAVEQVTDGLSIPQGVDLIIDALLGTGLSQPPRWPYDRVIQAINDTRIPVLAVDLPSGLDCDSGQALGHACIRARRTVTFVAMKTGFANPVSREYTGEVVVGDIGCPRELIDLVREQAAQS